VQASSPPEPAGSPELAPDEVGSYARAAVTWIEGAYLTIRPSFGDKAAIFAYRTEIFWDADRSSLAFRESERLDAAFSQQGVVSVPSFSGHIYLVTNEHGQYRLIVVGRPSINREMHGILTTLQVCHTLKPSSRATAADALADAYLRRGQNPPMVSTSLNRWLTTAREPLLPAYCPDVAAAERILDQFQFAAEQAARADRR